MNTQDVGLFAAENARLAAEVERPKAEVNLLRGREQLAIEVSAMATEPKLQLREALAQLATERKRREKAEALTRGFAISVMRLAEHDDDDGWYVPKSVDARIACDYLYRHGWLGRHPHDPRRFQFTYMADEAQAEGAQEDALVTRESTEGGF